MPDVKRTTTATEVKSVSTAPTGQGGQGFSITALVTGIVGMVLFFIPLVGFITSTVGVVFASLSLKRGVGRGLAIAGLITGILGIIGSVLAFLVYMNMDWYGDYYQPYDGYRDFHLRRY